MKKFMMIAAMMLMSIGAFAQQGTMAVGANLGYAGYGDGYSPFGIGAKFQYEFIENWRGEFAYNYWFPKDKAGVMDFNLNVQYLFPVAENIKIYPMAGFTLGMTHGEAFKEILDGQEAIPGFNIGIGAEYYLSPELKLNLDVKYQSCKKTKKGSYSETFMGQTVSVDYDIDLKYDGPVIQVGVAYVF